MCIKFCKLQSGAESPKMSVAKLKIPSRENAIQVKGNLLHFMSSGLCIIVVWVMYT